jgi:uncharacterized protein (TIGR02646 family)
MRRVTRAPLDAAAVAYLARRQNRLNAGQPLELAWRTARPTKTMGRVKTALLSMVGIRERCFFCEDSRGSDIEHFWPKTVYPARAFVWDNLLLLCASCNRKKGSRFPLDAAGQPLFVNPTIEDPWDFLFFEEATGMIVARVDAATAVPDPKGQTTSDPNLLPLNVEAITEGRTRTVRRLRRSVNRYLAAVGNPAEEPQALLHLTEEVHDADAQGVVAWYFRRDGRNEPPFSTLRINQPAIWAHVLAAIP